MAPPERAVLVAVPTPAKRLKRPGARLWQRPRLVWIIVRHQGGLGPLDQVGFEGESAMQFASCYDYGGTVLASSIFLNITAVLMILAALPLHD